MLTPVLLIDEPVLHLTQPAIELRIAGAGFLGHTTPALHLLIFLRIVPLLPVLSAFVLLRLLPALELDEVVFQALVADDAWEDVALHVDPVIGDLVDRRALGAGDVELLLAVLGLNRPNTLLALALGK